jgi:hypothetical protein
MNYVLGTAGQQRNEIIVPMLICVSWPAVTCDVYHGHDVVMLGWEALLGST